MLNPGLTLMELVLDYFVILLLVFIGASAFLLIKLRPKFPASVNCWFCNQNSRVPYKHRNEWYCTHCEQYNGFSSDGGYNKIIPAQYESHLSRYASTAKKDETLTRPEKLCRSCTVNQQLKIQQLASFVPIDEENFDEEVEQYRIHLERAYALCASCEGVLKDTLTRQRAWLLSLKTKEKRESFLRRNSVFRRLLAVAGCNVQRARAASSIVCVAMLAGTFVASDCLQMLPSLAVLLSSMPSVQDLEGLVHLCHQSVVLACVGTSLQAFAALAAGTNRRLSDMCAMFCWLLWQLQYWIKPHMPINFITQKENYEIFHVVTLLATLSFNVLPFLIPRNQRTILKKIKTEHTKRFGSELNGVSSILERGTSGPFTMNRVSPYDQSCPETEFQNGTQNAVLSNSKVSETEKKFRKTEESYGNSKNISNKPKGFFTNKNFSTESYFERELHRGLGSLSLGTGMRPRNKKWAFETRVYGCKEFPGLFTTDKRPRPLLSPPRLGLHKNVTRSPWSAGGYWQTPVSFTGFHDCSPLSRSSSRSSGFGSMSSRAAAAYDAAASPPGSRAGSVCAGDADRFSVHSLPAYPPPYFQFYGPPYIVPHIGAYPVTPSYCFSPTPTSLPPQSSPPLSDSDSSCASQKSVGCSHSCRGLFDVLREHVWLSIIIVSSLLLNTVATSYFILSNNSAFTKFLEA